MRWLTLPILRDTQVNGVKSASYPAPKGVEILGAYKPEFESVLTGDALAFLADLARKYTDW